MSNGAERNAGEMGANGTAERNMLALVDTPGVLRLLEIRAAEAVQQTLTRWGKRAVWAGGFFAALLGYAGITVNARLNERIGEADAKIRGLEVKGDEVAKHVSKATESLEIRLDAIQQKADLFQDLARETERFRHADWLAMLAEERQRTRAEAEQLENDIEGRKKDLVRLFADLEKNVNAEVGASETVRRDAGKQLERLKNLESSLGALPTVQFVILRRDTPLEVDLGQYGPPITLTLIHTRTWKGQKGAELAIVVPGLGSRRRLLTENNPERLTGTDFRIRLLFTYDFPVFGATVDFVMLKLWREYGTEGPGGPG